MWRGPAQVADGWGGVGDAFVGDDFGVGSGDAFDHATISVDFLCGCGGSEGEEEGEEQAHVGSEGTILLGLWTMDVAGMFHVEHFANVYASFGGFSLDFSWWGCGGSMVVCGEPACPANLTPGKGGICVVRWRSGGRKCSALRLEDDGEKQAIMKKAVVRFAFPPIAPKASAMNGHPGLWRVGRKQIRCGDDIKK